MVNNIGFNITAPTQECGDVTCPFHGHLKVRGSVFVATVIGTKANKTAKVEWMRKSLLPKYERYENIRTKINVHNPTCVNAIDGDVVKIIGCRALSKTKNFVIVEKISHVKGFEDLMASRQEAKVKEKTQEKAEEKETQASKNDLNKSEKTEKNQGNQGNQGNQREEGEENATS